MMSGNWLWWSSLPQLSHSILYGCVMIMNLWTVRQYRGWVGLGVAGMWPVDACRSYAPILLSLNEIRTEKLAKKLVHREVPLRECSPSFQRREAYIMFCPRKDDCLYFSISFVPRLITKHLRLDNLTLSIKEQQQASCITVFNFATWCTLFQCDRV